jgi:hypothetical protein
VVLFYKLLIDSLNAHAGQVRDACRSIGTAADGLPEFAFPAARVVTQGGFFSPLKVNDLVIGYDRGLVVSADELDGLAARTEPGAKVEAVVIRNVLVKTNHPLTGMDNVYQWQAVKLDLKGGPLKGTFADHGTCTPITPLRDAAEEVTPEPLPVAVSVPEPLPEVPFNFEPLLLPTARRVEPTVPPVPEVLSLDPDPVPAADQVFRFPCVQCGKRVKAQVGDAGKRCRCPKCGTRFQVPAPAAAAV